LKPGWGDNGPLSAMPLTYVPVAQVADGFLRLVHGWFRPTFVVRSSLAPSETAGAIRTAVAAVDPLLPIASVRTMAEVQSTSLMEQRLLAMLLLGLAIAAVAVGAIGLHGLIATSVAERAREIGIRLALGSTIGSALRSLAFSGIVLAGIGTVLGLAGAALFTPIVRPFVWGVGVNDPVTFAMVAGVLFTVAAAASLLPALRILRLDPATTLRG
jgi:ABC-type antimicrobial peptide transport system permease subunit